MKLLPMPDRCLPPGRDVVDDRATKTTAKPSGRITMRFRRHFHALAALGALALVAGATPGHADPRVGRSAKHYGNSYLPLTRMQEKRLRGGEGSRKRLHASTEWLRSTGGPPMNE